MSKQVGFRGPLSTFRRRVPAPGGLADFAVGHSFDHTTQRSVIPRKLFGNTEDSYRTMNRTGEAAQANVSSAPTPRDNELK